MPLTVYHLKTCDTCRKAIKALGEKHALDLIDVRADGVAEVVISGWIDEAGYETVLNTRSTTWRGLEDAEKADMNAAKALALLVEHPTLIKRPVITDGDKITIGWKADAQDAWV